MSLRLHQCRNGFLGHISIEINKFMILEAKFGASDFPLKNHYLIEKTITTKKIAVRDGIKKNI